MQSRLLPAFNPRTHLGCDAIAQAFKLRRVLAFQSTHPPRVRHLCGGSFDAYSSTFNPRTHLGCDFRDLDGITAGLHFQSTHPPRVRPPSIPLRSPTPEAFQSTHPPRVRLQFFLLSDHSDRFQSTHPPRVRLPLQSPLCHVLFLSIHAPT
ncbi:hypothetical protein DJ90_5985 [Paenibacillus macerans]|uniref:Uncharacterized protein n=1 Tax=Paenibacillus macerans TaxID=44252 RepID=A0A090Y4Y4_PAEMA|nr:hypothetical protein DJ90_5985 [Paenibacillus macerans]